MKKLFLFLFLSVMASSLAKAQTQYQVSTIAGSGVSGSDDGTGTTAQFSSPTAICRDASGNLYVVDKGNNKIRKISPAGVVSTFAGSGVAGYADGTGTAAQFNSPSGICIDAKGNLYVSDELNNRIRKITPAGVVSTFAGSGSDNQTDTATATGTSAVIYQPHGICIDASGNLYVSELIFIRKITPQAKVTVFHHEAAIFHAICVDKNGNIFVVGRGLFLPAFAIVKITPSGVSSFFTNEIEPNQMLVDDSGNVFVAAMREIQDLYTQHGIYKISPSGSVVLIAGSVSGYEDAVGSDARFLNPAGICKDTSGNFYVTDGNRIRKITPVKPKPPVVNYLDMPGNLCLGSGVNFQPTVTGSQSNIVVKIDSIKVTAPKAICRNDSLVFVVNANDSILCFNVDGKLVKVYNTMPLFTNITAIAADNQNRVYVVAPDLTYSSLTSVYRLDSASNWDFGFSSSGSTTSGVFSNISAITLGPDGKLYAADSTNGTISTIDTSGAKVTSLPSPSPSHSFYKPAGLAFSKNGQLYLADVGLNKILYRDASDNNYYDAVPGLDTLKWNVNSLDIDTNSVYPAFFFSSNTSGPVSTYIKDAATGSASLFNYAKEVGFSAANPAGLVNMNGGGLPPVTWVANTHGNNVKRVQIYYYSITPALPKGLYFDFVRGDIAGTPQEVAPSTTYTITIFSSLGNTTKKITFGVTPSTLLSNKPGTGTSLKNQPDGMKITYTDPSNCSKMVSIEDSVGGTKLGAVQVKQTVYPTVATFSTSKFVGRTTEIKTQDPNATARLKLYFTYEDIDNYNKYTDGAKLSNDTTKGSMQMGILQLHTDSTGHVEEIKHDVTATWVKKDENWMADFKVDKFSTFYAGGMGMVDSFSCANTGHDSVVTTKAYNFNGQILKKSGTYTTAFVNKAGCDSVVTLKLTSNCANTGKDSVLTHNAYYVWKGDTLKTSGTYIDTFVNKGGCDSVVTLKLQISCNNTGKDSEVSQNGYYVWHGDTLRASGTYTYTFVNSKGCDSVVTLTLTIKTGLAESTLSSISIYPNPSTGVFTIDMSRNSGTVNYTVTSVDGKTVREKLNISAPVTTIDLAQEKPGIYFLKVTGQSFTKVFRLMKQ